MALRAYQRLDWVVTICCLALLGYITWQAQQGRRGIGYSETLTVKAQLLQTEHDQLAARNAAFEKKVKLLRPESIDPDLVDELARRTLGLGRDSDLVVLRNR